MPKLRQPRDVAIGHQQRRANQKTGAAIRQRHHVRKLDPPHRAEQRIDAGAHRAAIEMLLLLAKAVINAGPDEHERPVLAQDDRFKAPRLSGVDFVVAIFP